MNQISKMVGWLEIFKMVDSDGGLSDLVFTERMFIIYYINSV